MNWEINIKKVTNGYILTTSEEQQNITPKEEDNPQTIFIERQEVIEETNRSGYEEEEYKTNDNEKIALAKMLETVADYFGENNDRFGNENLNIRFDREGHKYEEKE